MTDVAAADERRNIDLAVLAADQGAVVARGTIAVPGAAIGDDPLPTTHVASCTLAQCAIAAEIAMSARKRVAIRKALGPEVPATSASVADVTCADSLFTVDGTTGAQRRGA